MAVHSLAPGWIVPGPDVGPGPSVLPVRVVRRQKWRSSEKAYCQSPALLAM
jgi:hypothetical protein